VECGVTGILNYAPISVTVPAHVRVRDVDPVVALQSMAYYLKTATPEGTPPADISSEVVRTGFK
jgi:redox-sensing transcriptional repressor